MLVCAEDLQAGAAAYATAFGGQLGVADTESAAAMWALGLLGISHLGILIPAS